jgi:PhzF family phenazine biosynthesis protein
MATLKAGIIDVFGEVPLSGNPLAVVEEADDLSDGQMRAIAREFNQAETTFLLRSHKADWKLRSFTSAGAEVSGAGHNALGAWLWLGYRGQLGALDSPTTFRQEIGSEVLPITLERRGRALHGRMRQGPLKLGATLDNVSALASALGLNGQDLPADTLPRVADTGAGHLLVRVKHREIVDTARPRHEHLLPVLASVAAEGCYLFSFDGTEPAHAYARFFNPTVGLWEDAATGTAAGPLIGFLDYLGLLGPERTLRVEQGVLMGRRSIIELALAPDAELSGSGVIVMQGELNLSPP